MAEWPSGTVTFLFTDLEGSTQRWHQYPTEMGAALARHNRLLRDAISAHGGVVLKTVGGAVCAAFATAPAAVAAALTAQRVLYGEPWGTTGPLRVHMALHAGQAEAQAGDYLGGPLNRVARLLATEHGGQILLSGPTADLVSDYLPPGVTLRDLGTHRLKDVYRPEHIFQLVAPDLPADFAPLASAGPAPPERDPPPTSFVAERQRRGRRAGAIGILAVAVLAAVVAGAVAMRWIGTDDGDRDGNNPGTVVAATRLPAVALAPSPTVMATLAAAVPAGTVASATTGAAANGTGHGVYTVYDGQPGAGRVYRIAAREGATPENLSSGLDALSQAALDTWIAMSPDGTKLLVGTERFDPECVSWPCLAVASADLSAAEVFRIDGEVVHPIGPGAIAGDMIALPAGDGPHETDLWATRQQGERWDIPILLTGGSPYAYHAAPALAADGKQVVFECGDRPYGKAGTALCEVDTNASGPEVSLTPTDVASDLPTTAA